MSERVKIVGIISGVVGLLGLAGIAVWAGGDVDLYQIVSLVATGLGGGLLGRFMKKGPTAP